MRKRFGAHGLGTVNVLSFEDIVNYIDKYPACQTFHYYMKGRQSRKISVTFENFKDREEFLLIILDTMNYIDKKIG